MKIAVLGGGSWGTALAVHLAKKNYNVKIWEFVSEQAREMQEERICRLLPGTKLAENIFVSDVLEKVISDCDLLLVAVPSDHVEKTIEQAAYFLREQSIIICSKGFGANLKFLSDAVSEKVKGEVYCLFGPTHAEEVCKGMFSGIVLAGPEGRKELQKTLEGENLKIDLSDDLIGVQVAAALKNILAVFVGVLDGMNLGDNAKAYLMVRGLNEIKEIGLKMGGQKETFSGLAGIGDMIVTCNSQHSRNRYVGQEVGKGRKLDAVIEEMHMVAEGVTTIKNALGLKEKLGLELPLITGIYQILFENKDPLAVLKGI